MQTHHTRGQLKYPLGISPLGIVHGFVRKATRFPQAGKERKERLGGRHDDEALVDK